MPVSYARASRIASSCPKDFNFASFMYANEAEYPMWTNPGRWLHFVKSRPESVTWNSLVAALALITFVLVSSEYESKQNLLGLPLTTVIDVCYNAIYGLHVAAHFYRFYDQKYLRWYLIDIVSYAHYLTTHLPAYFPEHVNDLGYIIKISCYHMRLHRPFRFLWGLNDYYLKGSMVGTLCKYWYIFTLLHVMCANLYLWINLIEPPMYESVPEWLHRNRTLYFYRSVYVIYKRFVPIGMDKPPIIGNEGDRMFQLLALITGSLMVTGITIASLSLAIGLHMRPEELFRARVRIIMNDMKSTSVPTALRKKVETFYRMYWHKQKAVSVTQLLPTYPPTLANTIFSDIYFEAQQKSVILRDLSYQFLSELAQKMKTINYIPGDIIIKRNSYKFAMIYISYGDVEMLTAEDDETPILRFTRGSIMNPCAGAAAIASSKAHVCIRAATFCTAHVLNAIDIWRICRRYGRFNGQSFILHSSFKEHFEKVLRHYAGRPHPPAKHKSTILVLKRNLIELKEARDENGHLILGRQDMFLELARCYIMRNQADSALTEESDSICLRPTFPCILQPASSLLIMWQIFVAILTVIVTFVHPYNLVFIKTQHIDFKFFDFMTTVVYIVDILIHLSTGAKLEEGVPVTFLQTSSQNVSNFWLLLDVISVIPIFTFVGDGSFAGINKLCKLPKVFRILKEMEDISLFQSNALRFFAYCLLIILLNWLVATLQQGYMCFQYGYCNLKTITTQPFWEKGPLEDSEKALTTRLWYSIYWALSFTTFTAHKTSDLTMLKWHMQLFIMMLLEGIAKLRVVMEAAYSATIMVTETMRNEYKSCIDNVTTFLVKNDVDPVLRHRFINYLHLCWYTDRAYSITHGKNSIHFDLPQHVFQDISALQRNKYIVCVPFMRYLPQDIVKELCAKAHLFYTSPHEILLNTGDICNEIYVIKQGFCEVIDPMTKSVVSIITSKKHFGDVECLMRLPAYYTVRAASHVQIFSISRKDLSKAMATPKIKDAILHAKLQPEYVKMLHNRQEPFLRYEMPQPATSRQVFPVLRKHEPDTAFLQPFQRLGFFSITKSVGQEIGKMPFQYIFPRFTIRPDGTYLRRYEWFRAMCAFISAIIFPVYYLLRLQFDWLTYVAYFLDFSAYYDLFQRLLVAYFDSNGVLVYHPVSTAAHYLRGPMIADLLGCLPFEIFDDLHRNMHSNATYNWTPNTMQLLMCNRILQLYRFPAALGVLDEYIGRQDIIFVIKAIPIFMVVLNTLTSFLVLLSVTVYGGAGGKACITPLAIDFEPWIITNGHAMGYNITATPFNVLITVSYWAAYEITTTGLNCFQPNRYAQVIVLIVGMLIGSIMIPYMAVRVLSIRSNVNQALAAFQENMKDLTVFMKREKVHHDLQEEALSFYEYTWEKTGSSNYRSILKLCDQITLRTDAILHIYGQTFHKCPILYHCDPSLQRLVGRAVHNVYYRAGMTVIERDDVTRELYFVDYGVMEARDPEDDDLIACKLPRGSMFGNLQYKSQIVCPNRFVANTNLHLLMIDSWLFYKILKDFPAIGERMVKYRQHDETYIVGSMRAQSVVQAIWKERSMRASTIIVVTRKGILKYIHTHGKVLQIILIIASIICVYGDLYNAVFQDNRVNLIVLLYLMDVLFVFKIAINYYMPYITEEKSESRKALMKAKLKYYRGDFKYDILSVLPIELSCFFFKNQLAAFAYLRLNRFLRVTTIHSTLNLYHERLSINLTATTITATFIWFTLFVHTCTCIWHLLGVIHDNIEPKTSWRWAHDKKYFCTNEYICSLYFVMTTFSQNGVGDILPRQHAEVIFVILLMILSTMMYMIYVGEFSNIMQYQFFRCFSFYKEFLELKEFLKYNNVSNNLVNLTNRYTLHLWRTSRGLQVPLFLKDAPPRLRHKLMAAAYMLHLKKHPAFKHCERPFLRHVVAHFKPFTYLEDMYVVREGEITNSMYFVHQGSVKEIVEDFNDENCQIFEMGDFFGTSQGLNHETPYVHSYKTITKSQILTLSLDDWEYLLQHFPSNKETIYKPHKGLSEYKGKKHVVITKSADIHRYNKYEDEGKSPAKPNTLTEIPSGRISEDAPAGSRPRSSIRFGIPEKSVSQDKSMSDEVGATPREMPRERLSIIPASSIAAAVSRSDANLTPSESSKDTDSIQVQAIKERRSTVLDIESPTGKNRLEKPEDTTSLDSKSATDEYVRSQLKRSPEQTSPLSDISRWPLDSRRKMSMQEQAAVKEYKPSKTGDDLTKPELIRRGTTIEGTDKGAEVKELKEIRFNDQDDENTQKPAYDYSRRKSTIYGIDKGATDKELPRLKDIRHFSEDGVKRQVKVPVPSTRLPGIPLGQISQDVPTTSRSKTSIRFGISQELEPRDTTAVDLKKPVDGVKDSPSRELITILPASSIVAAASRSAENITAHSSKVSENLPHLTTEIRRSTVLDIEKPAVKEELEKLHDTDIAPLDSKDATDKYVQSQKIPTKEQLSPQSQKTIYWPLDSRRKLSLQEMPVPKQDKPTAYTSKETDDPKKPKFIRRGTTIQGVDKAAIDKELKELSSDDEAKKDTRKPFYDYSRRKSTLYGTDKGATDKELQSLRNKPKDDVKVPLAPLTHLTEIPSGRTSQDVATTSRAKSSIRFGITQEPESRDTTAVDLKEPVDGVKPSPSRELITILPASSIVAAASRLADNITAHSSKVSENLPHLTTEKSKSTVLDVDKPAVKKELEKLHDTDIATEKYVQSQLQISTPQHLSPPSPNTINWPPDSGRKLSLQEISVPKKDKPTAYTSKETDDLKKPKFVRRGTTIQGIDKAAVDKELKELSSDDEAKKDTRKPFYDYSSRRKSTLYGTDKDKGATDKELQSLKNKTKDDVKVPSAPLTHLTEIPSGRISQDVATTSRAKSAIRFGIPKESEPQNTTVVDLKEPMGRVKASPSKEPSKELITILAASSIIAAASRSAVPEVNVHSSKVSEEPYPTIEKRRSTVLAIETPVRKQELEQLHDKDIIPLDNRHATDEYVKSQLKISTSEKLASISPTMIRWPLDSRRELSLQEIPVQKEDKPVVHISKEPDDLATTKFIQRGIQGIDEAAVDKELSSKSQDEDTVKPVYDYSRRKSTVYGRDKGATDKELLNLKDVRRILDDKATVPSPSTRLTGAPSRRISQDLPISKSKSAIRFGIPPESESDSRQDTNEYIKSQLNAPKFPQSHDTTIHGVDKVAAAEKKRDIGDTPKPYSRRKSTVYGIDKGETDRELAKIKDITTPSSPAPTQPSTSKRSSVEETEIKTTFYEPEERSILAPPHERNEAFDSLMSVHMPRPSLKKPDTRKETPLKSIIGKSFEEPAHEKPPVTKRTKSFMERIRRVTKPKLEDEAKDNLMQQQDEATTAALLKYLEEKEKSSKPPSRTRIRSGVSFNEGIKLHKSSIFFKDIVTTFKIPGSDSSKNEDDEPSTSQKARSELRLHDSSKKQDHIQTSVKNPPKSSEEDIELKTIKTASIDSIESVMRFDPDKEKEAKSTRKEDREGQSQLTEGSSVRDSEVTSSKKSRAPKDTSSK